jgi:hypothetical protein
MDLNANDTMEIVKELRSQNMVQGVDFDFTYNPTRWDPMTGHGPTDYRHSVFKFYKDKLATMFILKYGNASSTQDNYD